MIKRVRGDSMGKEANLAAILEKEQAVFYQMSDRIWDYAELAFAEVQSSALQADFLEQAGFTLQRNLAAIATAFMAEYTAPGQGKKPIIGICGEFDALPAMSQKEDATHREPLQEGGNGHACGHHLLGTAGVAAAFALKQVLEKANLPGTVRYYGCPAEEGFSGKSFLDRAGVFADLDIALCWHPQQYHCIEKSGALANIRLRYRFLGISANPAHSGHLGRSALDAAELMNIGANYLREHMTPDARIHYAYEDAGGKAANVIPAQVEVNYCIRARKMQTVLDLKKRLDKIAQGAALMTETEVEGHVYAAYADYIGNPVVEERMACHLQNGLPLAYTPEEYAYAMAFRNGMGENNMESVRRNYETIAGLQGAALQEKLKQPICDFLLPPLASNGSTDFGDVSYHIPSGQFYAACFPLGAPPHSWQACAVGKSAMAHKGMLLAAKVLAKTAWDFIENPALVPAAKKAMQAQGITSYVSPIAKNVLPGGKICYDNKKG